MTYFCRTCPMPIRVRSGSSCSAPPWGIVPRPMDGIVYKVLRNADLAEAKAKGHFGGSAADARDGFIHLSSGDQLESTLAKYFAGQKDLVLIAIAGERLGERLQWEPSRGGALFPHLYGPLDLDALLWEEPLQLGDDGRHRLPLRVLP